jgi:hypothetical protein
VEQPGVDTLEIFGDINQFHKEIQDIANMEQEISKRNRLPQPIKNANTWAAKYEALKQLSDDVDINTLNEAEFKTIHQAIKALEAELFCQMDDGKSTKEDPPIQQQFIKDQETPLPPPEPPPMMDECPSTPKPSKTAPDGSLLSEITRPMSPTNIFDFPYFELDGQNNNEVTQEILNLPILPSTTSRLPRLAVNRAEISQIKEQVEETMEFHGYEDKREDGRVSQVSKYNVIADVGTYGKTFIVSKAAKINGNKLLDSGANCSMTADITLLQNLQKLDQPIVIGLAITEDGETSATECTHVGDLEVLCDDGSTITTMCFYNPSASDTIVSPQSIIDQSNIFDTWKQVGRRFGQPGSIEFHGKGIVKSLTLQQNNGLYYCNSQTFDIINDFDTKHLPTINRLTMKDKAIGSASPNEDVAMADATNQTEEVKPRPKRRPKRYSPTSKTKVLESETWYLRLGGCNETTMEDLTKHAIGLPEHFEWHPFRFIDFKEQARIQKRPVGRNPTKVAERGKRFYFDFGFIRASNDDYTRPNKAKDRVVESYDGYNSYLLVVDELSKYSWIFLTKSKDPPIELTKLFLKEYAHVDGGKIRCDQGGELARSAEWRKMVLEEFQYYVEPTGADSPSQNGQVEKYNGTLGTIVRTLLYGAQLPAKYWSAAAVHAVYLMNRRIHSSIGMTPYEAWWDEQPDLSLLKVFGSRVCVKVTGQRRAKLDRHDFNGIFIGYTATDDNIKYIIY